MPPGLIESAFCQSRGPVKKGRETPAISGPSGRMWCGSPGCGAHGGKERCRCCEEMVFDLLASFPVEFQDFQVVSQLHKLCNIDHQLRMVRDILSGKSPQITMKRANALLRYSQYLASRVHASQFSRGRTRLVSILLRNESGWRSKQQTAGRC